jgi:hypothetical protein
MRFPFFPGMVDYSFFFGLLLRTLPFFFGLLPISLYRHPIPFESIRLMRFLPEGFYTFLF